MRVGAAVSEDGVTSTRLFAIRYNITSLASEVMRSTWASHVERKGDGKLAENRCPECGGEMEARKTEIAMGDCVIKSDIERLGEEWKKTTERRNWRLMTENVIRKIERKKMEREFMV